MKREQSQTRNLYASIRSRKPLLPANDALRWARLADKLFRNGLVRYGEQVSLWTHDYGLERIGVCAKYSTVRETSPYNPRWKDCRDHRRWIEDTKRAGLRWVGFADEICRGIDHNGWYTDEDCGEVIRGGVWQLPARHGRAQYVAGYVDPNNEGAAAIDFEIIEGERGGSEPYQYREDAQAEAARAADSFAESAADAERRYQREWRASNELAEKLDEWWDELTDVEIRTLADSCRDAVRAAVDALREARAACSNV